MRIVCTAFALLLFSSLWSQKSRVARDIIEDKNGSVLIGKIIEESDWALLFWSATTDTIEIEKTNVAMITRDATSFNSYESQNKGSRRGKGRKRPVSLREPYHKVKGYYGMFDMGGVIGGGAHFAIGGGKRITPSLSLGLEVGREFTIRKNTSWHETDAFWVFGGYGRYYLKDAKYRPFVSGRLGYGLLNNSFFNISKKGGMNIMPGGGVHIAARGGLRFLISIHQNLQKTSGTQSPFNDSFGNPVITTYDIWLNRTVLKVGIEF